MSEEFARRHIAFDQWFNVRDLGGYVAGEATVAWKQFYRAGAPSRLSEADIERVRGLGLATVIDLRRDDEASRDETHAVEALRAAHHRIPVVASQDALDAFVSGPGISAERYLAYLEVGDEAFRSIFEVLGDPASYPVVVHCSAGKDRTGVVSAMTLEMLGVSREVIEADYAMTNLERERISAFWRARGGGWFAEATPEQLDFALSVPPDAMGCTHATAERRRICAAWESRHHRSEGYDASWAGPHDRRPHGARDDLRALVNERDLGGLPAREGRRWVPGCCSAPSPAA